MSVSIAFGLDFFLWLGLFLRLSFFNWSFLFGYHIGERLVGNLNSLNGVWIFSIVGGWLRSGLRSVRSRSDRSRRLFHRLRLRFWLRLRLSFDWWTRSHHRVLVLSLRLFRSSLLSVSWSRTRLRGWCRLSLRHGLGCRLRCGLRSRLWLGSRLWLRCWLRNRWLLRLRSILSFRVGNGRVASLSTRSRLNSSLNLVSVFGVLQLVIHTLDEVDGVGPSDLEAVSVLHHNGHRP